ncbi:MAG: hypothetical protein IKJ62_04335 [Alphaproteobacteria bacterium]|nr:hypothetical protein [Alphaproteobacteria bacterium]
MKKLTAGIFTVLMGLVSVNAADAAVASKAYVDAKAATEASNVQTAAAEALSSAKSELEGKINAKVAQATYDAKVAELEAADLTFATTSAMTTELAKKQDVISDLQTIRDGAALGATSFQAANVAKTGDQVADDDLDKFVPTVDRVENLFNDLQTDLTTDVTNLSTAVDTLNGDATTEGSVKKQIADAVAGEVDRANNAYDAKGAAADALDDAKAYTDELANGTVKANADAIAALDTNYVSESEMNTFKTSNTQAIEAAQADATQALADAATAKTQADKGVADAATAKSAADAAAEAAAAAQTAADKAQADATQALADAATAKSAADAAQETANAAIPAPTDDCSNPTNKCVLTYNNAVYEWEVIERSGVQ